MTAQALLGVTLEGVSGPACWAMSQAAVPTGDLVGHLAVYDVGPTETLFDIARAENLGGLELQAANPDLDPWLPGKGTRLVLPTAHVLPDAPRTGIVVNLGDMRLYSFAPDGRIATTPVGIGREGYDTPLGSTSIVRKQKDPTWYPPKSIRADRPDLPPAVAPGPHNPLGGYALYLGWPSYLIHGTNQPDGVGRHVSRGCIRLYPEAIKALYDAVPVGTSVTVVNEAVKVGWHEGALFLEAHPEPDQLEGLETTRTFARRPPLGYVARIEAAAGERATTIDWALVGAVIARRAGIPVQITGTDRPPVEIFVDGAPGEVPPLRPPSP